LLVAFSLTFGVDDPSPTLGLSASMDTVEHGSGQDGVGLILHV